MTLEEAKPALEYLRAIGVQEFNGFELHVKFFEAKQPLPPAAIAQPKDKPKNTQPTEEELLFWSSPTAPQPPIEATP